jgi:3-oxoacyl-[acyl-carrier protein] reductase
LPGDGALWTSQQLDFLAPVRVGDEITIVAEVIKKIKRDKSIELKTEIYNQHKKKVTSGKAAVRVLEPANRNVKKDRRRKRRKVALVMGGTGDIGQEVALGLARDDFSVVIQYRNNRKVATSLKRKIEKNGGECYIVWADMMEERSLEEMVGEVVEQFGGFNLVVYCVGSPIPQVTYDNLEWNDFENQLNIIIKGPFNLCKKSVPFMIEGGGSGFIFVNSIISEQPFPEWTHYITAKSALTGMMRALAVELAPKGIRVNQVSPGMADTSFLAEVPEKAQLLIKAKTPLKRLASASDIANAICYLASSDSGFVTGETLRVNGGLLMR